MALQRVLESIDLLDGWTDGETVATALRARGLEVVATEVDDATTFLRVAIPGFDGISVGDFIQRVKAVKG